ncbi:alpha/beta hydrolase [Dactylosporangium sp. CA-092794]|uniref:alpha/beta hydrolase n=1 Tax=Dactylosporangium sp. CA-092794 TaxID=3239929 RepID=UPI003D8AC36C
MRKLTRLWAVAVAAATATAVLGGGAVYASVAQGHPAARPKPTVVLVHGAFADSSSWSGEIPALRKAGYPVVAVANPLRGLPSDSAYLSSILATIQGPIVVVGHSYAGMVISQAAATAPNVKALVYVAAFIPQVGESAGALNTKFPGSQLVDDNFVVRDGPLGTDIYLKQDRYGEVYAGGLSAADIQVASVTQRPITVAALTDPATAAAPAATPKWMVVALDDNAVPTQLQFFMAKRAGARITTVHSGHDVPATSARTVDRVILEAASTVH